MRSDLLGIVIADVGLAALDQSHREGMQRVEVVRRPERFEIRLRVRGRSHRAEMEVVALRDRLRLARLETESSDRPSQR
jgi:hypothetical protein